MDVESLQKSERRRASCLDVFLVMSVTFLFVALTAVATGGTMVVMELRSKVQSQGSDTEAHTSKLSGDAPAAGYKMKNFAYLEATESELMSSTMKWTPVQYGPGSSVGSNFLFNKQQFVLTPNQPGTYFMYIDLNITCTHRCSEGLLNVHVGDKLNCDVKLPAGTTPVTAKCWTVTQINGEGLLTQMIVPEGGLENWKLELRGTGFGMFLVE